MFSFACRKASAAILFVGLVSAQTLYHVSASAESVTEVLFQSFSVSAAGVGADGATTYVENVVESYAAIEYSDTTVTILSMPLTRTVTVVEDASGFRLTAPFRSGFLTETCGFGADGRGTCIEKLPFNSGTEALTGSGPVVPYYTLSAGATTPAPTATPTSPNHANRALPTALLLWGIGLVTLVLGIR